LKTRKIGKSALLQGRSDPSRESERREKGLRSEKGEDRIKSREGRKGEKQVFEKRVARVSPIGRINQVYATNSSQVP